MIIVIKIINYLKIKCVIMCVFNVKIKYFNEIYSFLAYIMFSNTVSTFKIIHST